MLDIYSEHYVAKLLSRWAIISGPFGTTYVTELSSSRTVLVRTVTQRCEIYAACDAAYLDMPLAEIS